MEIHLPNSAFLGNIDPFLKSFRADRPGELKITANKKWISVHPAVLCMVASLGLIVPKGNVSCEKFEARSKHYFERMGLFNFLGVDSGIDVVEHEPAGRFIPITQIKSSENLSSFLTDMVPLLHLEQQHAETLRYIVSELVRNVLEHAETEHGAILAAQYYPKSNTIRIGIADTGMGIRTSLGRSYSTDTNLEALRLALMPGVTGTTRREGGSEQNAGAGLFFIKSIARVNGDYFMIYSGDAMYKLLPKQGARPGLRADPFQDRHTAHEGLPEWRGTLVGIDIKLDSTEKFSQLLSLIRNTYAEAIRERRRARYKKPKFT